MVQVEQMVSKLNRFIRGFPPKKFSSVFQFILGLIQLAGIALIWSQFPTIVASVYCLLSTTTVATSVSDKQASEAGGSATGDRGDRGHMGHMGERGYRGKTKNGSDQ